MPPFVEYGLRGLDPFGRRELKLAADVPVDPLMRPVLVGPTRIDAVQADAE